jgi:hypothetical protein
VAKGLFNFESEIKMAKVPISTSDGIAVNPSKTNPKLTASIDLQAGTSLPSDITLGHKVELCIIGTVVSLRGAEMSQYEDEKGKKKQSIYPGSLKLEITKLSFDSVGEFDELDNDKEE